MKKMTIIAGLMLFAVILLLPATRVEAATERFGMRDAADNPVQLACDGQQKGNQTGPRDGTKGENAPRDGRGAQRGGRGNGQGARDGSGSGARQGQGGGPRDGSGPGCQNG